MGPEDACEECGRVHTCLADDEACSEMLAEREEEEAIANEEAIRVGRGSEHDKRREEG